VVAMQQKTFAAVKKSQAKDVVIKERQLGTDEDVDQTEAAVSLRDCDLGPRRRITVHVINVAPQSWVGIVNERVFQPTRWSIDLDCWMRAIFLELARAAPNQAQLGIGIKASIFNQATKKEIFARNPETLHRVILSCHGNFIGQFGL